ncbi:hypothetical protein IWX49DRAFT_151125 [Phyllosticta citricarpa]|uniref:FAD/NAD(P)-binding domain-containing protein n=2 Tax=Phyllosticta TaxID=121621 RepID=A0ABR1MI52_9PEZI
MLPQSALQTEVDVVVIGAGFGGLGAAKAYLQCAPETNLVILDTYPTIGGVWSQDRIYPTLRSNNQLGTLELPDYPMHDGFGVAPRCHIPGKVVHKYLCEYSDNFGLTGRIRFNSMALSAEKQDDGRWKLHVVPTETDVGGREYELFCNKLIVATGLTSRPEAVHYKGEEDFNAPILNSAALATEGVRLTKETPEHDRQVTILGGSKSAYDSVYMFASNGFQVNWVIRKSGYGPTWMAPPHIKIPGGSLWTEMVPLTRILTWFSPCIWAQGDSWARRFLQGTRLGRFFVRKFFERLGSDVVNQSGLTSHPELQKLIPDENVMWFGTSLAILNYDTPIHDFIRNGSVQIYREDVTHLSEHTINLADGTRLTSPGGLITATNWQWAPNLDIRPAHLHAELGIPSASYTATQTKFWSKLDAEADRHILQRFPILNEAPKPLAAAAAAPPTATATTTATITVNGDTKKTGITTTTTEIVPPPPSPDAHLMSKKPRMQPFRLYRFLAPPGLTATGDRSLVFQGYVANLLNQVRNEVTGLWAYAYLNNSLAADDNDALSTDPTRVYKETALQTRFCRLRYPFGYGDRFPDFVWEQLPYFDLLLSDLGLEHRRKGGWWSEWTSPYRQADYRGVTREWLEMRAAKGKLGA